MEIMRKYEISKLHFPVDGFNYNAAVWLSTDGGQNYYYCGIGKYTKTFEEAQEFCNQYETDHK